MNPSKTVAVIGGGAAGFFGAIACAKANPGCKVVIFEKNRQLLSKVKISGGGRCNVTHACFDPKILCQHYPRGGIELRGPFSRFQPRDTVDWFKSHGVDLKTEADGRMFPVTDSSETIISCFLNEAKNLSVEVKLECGVLTCEKQGEGFCLHLSTGELFFCDKVFVATGSSPKVFAWLENLGHTIVPLVPSLFTFNIPTSPLHQLSGISVPKCQLELEECRLKETGPLLITHWGFSGPAVLKLSAFGAKFLHDRNYRCRLKVNWLPDFSKEELLAEISTCRIERPGAQVSSDMSFGLPKNLWKVLVEISQIPSDLKWSMLSKSGAHRLAETLSQGIFLIDGKTTYKQEFVTCGGVKLSEVDFRTMESRICQGLYFAGEVLDIDGITGGFNFQSAWTTAWIAGQAL